MKMKKALVTFIKKKIKKKEKTPTKVTKII